MNSFSYSLTFSFSIVSNSHFSILIEVADIFNYKQRYFPNTKIFSFKISEKKYSNLVKKKKFSKTNFIKPWQIRGTLSYWTSALFWNYLSQNLAYNSKEKLQIAYFPTPAESPNFQNLNIQVKILLLISQVCQFLLILCPFREMTITPLQSLCACPGMNPDSYLTPLIKDRFGWSLQTSPSIFCIGILLWGYLTSTNYLFCFSINQILHFVTQGFSTAVSNGQLCASTSETTHITDLDFQKGDIPWRKAKSLGNSLVYVWNFLYHRNPSVW